MNQLLKTADLEGTEEDLDIIENLLKKHPEVLTASGQEKEPQHANLYDETLVEELDGIL